MSNRATALIIGTAVATNAAVGGVTYAAHATPHAGGDSAT